MLFFAKDLQKNVILFSCVLNVSTDPLASDSRFNVVLCPSVLTNESVSCHRVYRLCLVLRNQRATVGVEVKKLNSGGG